MENTFWLVLEYLFGITFLGVNLEIFMRFFLFVLFCFFAFCLFFILVQKSYFLF